MLSLLIILYERLYSLIQEHLTAFLRGAVVAVIPSGIFLFGTPMLQVHFVVAYTIKALGVGLLTFLSGVCSALATDFVKSMKKWRRERKHRRMIQKRKPTRHEDNNHLHPD